jgi:hypothetical protein
MRPSKELLDECLSYDPATGHFHWLIETRGRRGSINPGDIAGTIKDGYVQIKVRGVLFRAHIGAWFIVTGEWPPPKIDVEHKNGNRSDNRWQNLRLATRSQNNMNADVRSDNLSGCRGVSWRADIGKWHARIVKGGRTSLLGNYDDLAEAIAARHVAERGEFGEFSVLSRSD